MEASSDDFVSRVVWNDGLESVGFVRSEGPEFVVYGSRYLPSDGFASSILVYNVEPDTPVVMTGTGIPVNGILVSESPIFPISQNIVIAEGKAITSPVLRFRDRYDGRSLSSYQSTIRFPDGETRAGTISFDSATQEFSVLPSTPKWFRSERSGEIEVDVSVDGKTVTGKTSLLVLGAEWTALPSSTPIVAQAGVGLPITTVLGRFQVATDRPIDTQSITSRIKWGDGTIGGIDGIDVFLTLESSSSGSPAVQTYRITGTHTYRDPIQSNIDIQLFELGTTGLKSTTRLSLSTSIVVNGLGSDFNHPVGTLEVSSFGQPVCPAVAYSVSPNEVPYLGRPFQAMPIDSFDRTIVAKGLTWNATAGIEFSGSIATLSGAGIEGVLVSSLKTPNGAMQYNLSYAHKYERPGSYVIGGMIYARYEVPIPGCSLPAIRKVNMPFVTGVNVQAPNVSVAALSIETTPGQSINFNSLIGATSGLGNWTVATVEWGNGKVTLLEYANGSWNAFSGPSNVAYLHDGNYATRISILSDSKSAYATGTIKVKTAAGIVGPLQPNLSTSSVPQFAPVSANDKLIRVLDLKDTNPRRIGGAHEATVNWALGPAKQLAPESQGTNNLVASAQPVFLAPGSYPYTVQVKDQVDEFIYGGSVLVTAAEISNLQAVSIDSGKNGSRREATIARFNATGLNDPFRFRADVDWGDGTRSPGTVISSPTSPGTYDVVASHTYTNASDFNIRVSVQDGGSTGNSKSVQLSAAINEAQAGKSVLLHAGHFEAFRHILPFPNGAWTTPSWNNNWAFMAGNSPYHILFSNMPKPAGLGRNYDFNVGGWFDDAVSTDVLRLSIHGTSFARNYSISAGSINEGNKLPKIQMEVGIASQLEIVAFASDTFDTNGAQARIDWGNGSTSFGTVERRPDKSYVVKGGHAYLMPGTHPVTISVTSTSGPANRIFKAVAVANWKSITRAVPEIAATKGLPIGRTLLATVPANSWSPPWANVSDATLRATLRREFQTEVYFTAGVSWGGTKTSATIALAEQTDDLLIYGDFAFNTIGLQDAFVRIETLDGVAIQTAIKVNVTDIWSLTSLHRTNGLGEGHAISTGPSGDGSASILIGTGDVRLTHPVDLDASPGSSVSGNPELVYDSGTVNVKPIVEGLLKRKANTDVLPNKIKVRVLWGDSLKPSPWVEYNQPTNTSELNYNVAAQFPEIVGHSGIYKYQLQVQLEFVQATSITKFTMPGTSLVKNPVLYMASDGIANIIVRDRQPSDYPGGAFDDLSPWGKGWSLSSVPRLILEENNDLLWASSYGARRWKMNDNDRIIWENYRKSSDYRYPTLYPTTKQFSGGAVGEFGIVAYEAEDPKVEVGTLKLDLNTLTFIYNGLQQTSLEFDHLGLHRFTKSPSFRTVEQRYDQEGQLNWMRTSDVKNANESSATFSLPVGGNATIYQFGARNIVLQTQDGFVSRIQTSGDLADRVFTKGTGDRIASQSWDGTSASFEYTTNIQTISKVRVGSDASVFDFVPINSVALPANSLIAGVPLAKEELTFGTNGLGNRINRFELDKNSRILSLQRFDGATLVWTRDPETRDVKKYKDGREIETDYVYNDRRLLKTQTAPDQGTQTFDYSNDKISNWSWPLTVSSFSQSYEYFANLLLKTISGSVSSNETMTLDGYETETVTDERGYRTRNVYDQYSRLVESFSYLAGFFEVRTAKYEYDDNGNVKKFTDGDGKEWIRSFDARNRLRSETSPLGFMSTATYWAFGPVKETTSPTGSVSEYSYYASGLLSKEVHAKGAGADEQTTQYFYLQDQSLWRVIDPTNFETRSEPIESWGARKTKTSQQVTEAGGSREFWTITKRDGNGNVVETLDDLNNKVTTEFDSANRPVTNVVTPSPLQVTGGYVDQAIVTTITTYDYDGLVKSQLVRQGQAKILSDVSYEYNQRRQLIKKTEWGNVTDYKYDLSGNLNYVKTPEGIETTTIYNQLQLPRFVTTTDVSGRGQGISYATLMIYDWRGNLLTSTLTGTGLTASTTAHVYDSDGRRTKTTLDLEGADAVTDFEYYEDNRLKKETMPVHNSNGDRFWTQYTYDKLGRVRTTTDPLGTSYTDYFTSARKVVSKDRKSNETETITDELGRTIQVKSPVPLSGQARPISKVEYNRGARTETSVSPDNSKVSVLKNYFGYGLKDVFTSADGATTFVLQVSQIDADGRVTETLDQFGNTSKTVYDRATRVATITTPNRDGTRTDTKKFDLLGNMIEYTIGSPKHTFVYDGFGNQVKWTDANGKSVNREFDAMGNVSQIVDRVGRMTKLEYDNQGRKVNEKWFASQSQSTPSDTITTQYHPAGNALSVTRTGSYGSAITYAYDNASRANSSAMVADGRSPVTYGYQYDANSNRTNLSVALAGTGVFQVNYSIDGLDRVYHKEQTSTTLASPSTNASIAKKLTFGYLVDGRLDFVNRYANSVATPAVVSSSYQYNALKLLSGVSHSAGNPSTVYFSQQLGWKESSSGPIGFRLLSNSKTVGSNTYNTSYQMFGDLQLKSESTSKNGVNVHSRSYAWDEYGNPTDVSPSPYSVGADNRLLSDLDFYNVYDDNGSLTRRTRKSDNSYETYTWDHRGKMTSATAYSSTNLQQWREEYFYDPLGRVAKTSTTDGSNAPTSKYSLFDGVDLEELVMELDTNGRVTKTVMHGPAVDSVMAEESISYASNGQATINLSWPLADHQGTPVVILREPTTVGGVRTVENQRIRTAFGEEIASTGSSSDTSFGFQGQLEDSKTGFNNFRARQLSTTAGRFISQDPIGFDAGDTNLYRMTGNHPNMATDPSGLFENGPEGLKIVILPKNELQVALDAEFNKVIGELRTKAIETEYRFNEERAEATRNAAIANQILSNIEAENKDREFRKLLQELVRRERAPQILVAAASLVIEPVDWLLTSVSIYNDPYDWTSYVGMMPIIPGAAGKLMRASDEVPSSLIKEAADLATSRGMSPSYYPNPDPPMSAPPVRYEAQSVEEVIRMRQGLGPTTKQSHGTSNIEAHHRQQRSVENNEGILDALEMQTHRGKGNHTRHTLPSELTPAQRAKEIREYWQSEGAQYILPGGEGI
jgi:RHS repeat-associated protein